MTALPIESWQQSLAEMGPALGAMVEALDRYEARWAAAAGPPATGAAPDFEGALARLERRFEDWGACLSRAVAAAQDVERLVADGEGAVARWRGALSGLQELIQRR